METVYLCNLYVLNDEQIIFHLHKHRLFTSIFAMTPDIETSHSRKRNTSGRHKTRVLQKTRPCLVRVVSMLRVSLKGAFKYPQYSFQGKWSCNFLKFLICWFKYRCKEATLINKIVAEDRFRDGHSQRSTYLFQSYKPSTITEFYKITIFKPVNTRDYARLSKTQHAFLLPNR